MILNITPEEVLDFLTCVSEFITNLCETQRESSPVREWYINRHSLDFVAGSAAEFYIRPWLTCIGDIDFVSVNRNQLACNGEFPVLPHDTQFFDEVIEVYKIEPYDEYPGFVRLRCLGNYIYNCGCRNFNNGTYEFLKMTTLIFLDLDPNQPPKGLSKIWQTFISYQPAIVSGPALKLKTDKLSSDSVSAMWCSEWPKQAEEWLLRRRKYDWPSNGIIRKVLEGGCHIVASKHRRCRNDIKQGRFSFSLAEVVLIRSSNRVQQIVYHMLRIFAKAELIIQKDLSKEDEVLCAYHLKTLMLWTCEEESPEFWTSSTVIEVCFKLLVKLSTWLVKRQCPNYFIASANLFSEDMKGEIVHETLQKIYCLCPVTLATWFTAHYIFDIWKISDCPNVLQSKGAETIEVESIEYQELKQSIQESRQNIFHYTVWYDCKMIEDKCLNICGMRVFKKGMLPEYKEVFQRPPRMSHVNLLVYRYTIGLLCAPCILFDASLYLMYAVSKVIFGNTKDDRNFVEKDIFDILNSLTFGYSRPNFPIKCRQNLKGSELYFLKVQNCLKNFGKSPASAEFRLRSRMSKEFLRKVLTSMDPYSKTVECSGLIYLAALFFVESDILIVEELCSSVFSGTAESRVQQEMLNGCCLLFIDDIASIVGFLLLFKHILETTRLGRQIHLDLRITPEVLAEYLLFLSREKKTSESAFHSDMMRMASPNFILDIALIALVKHKISAPTSSQCSIDRCKIYDKNDAVKVEKCVLNCDEKVRLLMDCSLEYMDVFFNTIYDDFGIRCNILSCYRALYLFKYHRYEDVLRLCDQIQNEPDIEFLYKEFVFQNVFVIPPLCAYFEEELQFLFGLKFLIDFLGTTNPHHAFGISECIEYVAWESCVITLRRHFLAMYLKIWCHIELKSSFSEILAARSALKCELPFEYFIRWSLSRKLERIGLMKQ